MDPNTSRSRRDVLVLSASAAAGMALLVGPLGSSALAAAPGRAPAPTGLRRDHWTPLVGRKVAVDGPSGRVRATVVGVEDLKGAPAGDPQRFAVELRATKRQHIAGLCPVTIPGRGVATLLVSDVDRGIRHRSAQIIVNNR